MNGRVDIGAVEYQPGAVNLTYNLQPGPGPNDVTLSATVSGAAPGSNLPTGQVRPMLLEDTPYFASNSWDSP